MVGGLDPIRKRLAQRLRQARKEKGYSQRDLGLLTGLSDKSISAYEKGKVIPPLEVLIRLAKELDKPVSYFVEEDLNPVEEASVLLKKVQEEVKSIQEKLEDIRQKLSQVK